jgi:hypothetical protein
MDVEINETNSKDSSSPSSPSSRRKKHVVMITDLDAEATDSENDEGNDETNKDLIKLPLEIRNSIKKIPNKFLLPTSCAFLMVKFNVFVTK